MAGPRLDTVPGAPHESVPNWGQWVPNTPELRYLETRWASLVSYGLTVKALRDVLPVDEDVNVTTVRRTTLEVARRCEAELGSEQPMFAEG